MSADLLRVGAQLDALIAAGARAFHVNVMDAHFVPNLTRRRRTSHGRVAGAVHAAGGPGGRAPDGRPAAARRSRLFADAADAITRPRGGRPAPAPPPGRDPRGGVPRRVWRVNPGTPVEHVAELADELDYVNVLAVEPGLRRPGLHPRPPRAGSSGCARLLPDRVADRGRRRHRPRDAARRSRDAGADDVRVGVVDLRRRRPGRRVRATSRPWRPGERLGGGAGRARAGARAGAARPGRVSPNPLVGAVVLRDGETVAEGWHEGPGLPHAEAAALAAAGGGRARRHAWSARWSPAPTRGARRPAPTPWWRPASPGW